MYICWRAFIDSLFIIETKWSLKGIHEPHIPCYDILSCTFLLEALHHFVNIVAHLPEHPDHLCMHGSAHLVKHLQSHGIDIPESGYTCLGQGPHTPEVDAQFSWISFQMQTTKKLHILSSKGQHMLGTWLAWVQYSGRTIVCIGRQWSAQQLFSQK